MAFLITYDFGKGRGPPRLVIAATILPIPSSSGIKYKTTKNLFPKNVLLFNRFRNKAFVFMHEFGQKGMGYSFGLLVQEN